MRLVVGVPALTCLGPIGLVARLQGARGLIAAGLVGAAFTAVGVWEVLRAPERRSLPPILRVLVLLLGPAALGFATFGGVLEAAYVGAALGMVCGLAVSVADAASWRD